MEATVGGEHGGPKKVSLLLLLLSTLLRAVLHANVQGFLMHRWMSRVVRQGR